MPFIFHHKEWNILSRLNMRMIAHRIPTSLRELSACDVSEQNIRLYGQSIVASVVEFVRSHQLERYVTAEGVGNVLEGKDGNAAAERGGTSTTLGSGGMVLPVGYTKIIKVQLKEAVDFWAREVSRETYIGGCAFVLPFSLTLIP